jgi:acetylornithine/N-succinyldiaminopimelate aminotransferase
MEREITRTTIQNEKNAIFQTYVRPEFVLEHGEGACLYDTAGHRYLDFVAGIGVNALGYGDEEITRTLSEQAAQLIHVSNLYHTIPGAELAKMLVERSPGFDRVFFCNSGAEAIEGAIKFARKYARQHYGEGKTTVVAFDGSFHGRTMGAVAMTAREKYRAPFMPVMPDVRFTRFNDVASLYKAITDDVCAVFVEPVQGEGGINVASDEFLQRLRTLCDRHNALLVVDEIQCGMGRTGTLWAHTQAQVQPDMLTSAKPLGGGLPIGAVLAKQRVADALAPGDHGTTFGGGPLVTAVAQVVLRRVSDPAFLQHVRDIGSYLDNKLQELAATHPDTITQVRGRGLMRGLRINGSAAAVRQQCHHEGLLVATAGEDVVRLLPPLIINETHVDEAVEKLGRALG